jgi:hypothetical protein
MQLKSCAYTFVEPGVEFDKDGDKGLEKGTCGLRCYLASTVFTHS